MIEKETLASIKNEFVDIYHAMRDLSDNEVLNGNDTSFRSHFERLHFLAAIDVHDTAAEELFRDPEFKPIIKRITRLKRVNGLRMELERARRIIASPDPWTEVERFEYYPNYLQLANMEFSGAVLKPGDRVVFLGSGPFPLSLISLCRQHGVEGIGIEKVAEYAALSREVVEVLELAPHIRVFEGDHFSLPLPEACQLVMVGADALPKDEIFGHFAKVLPKGTRLSYRIYEKGLRRLLDEQSIFDLPHDFKEYSRIRPEPPVNNTCVFLIKTSGA